MGVHEPRHHKRTAKILRLGRLHTLRHFSNGGDYAVFNQQIPVQDRMVRQKNAAVLEQETIHEKPQ
jgi:hypothetical protein